MLVTALRLAGPAVALAALCAGAAPVAADEVADFYRGKTMRLVDASGATGSYAIYTRIFARHFDRHVPGNPTLVVDAMEGGGGMKGQNYLYNAAPKDGLVIGSPMPSVVTAPLLYPKSAHFVPQKFVWLGNVTQLQTAIGVWKSTSPAKTLDEAKKAEVLLGSSGRASELTLTPLLLNAVLGTKFKVVVGYAGLGQSNQAIERGEIHGRSGGFTSWHQLKPDWFKPEEKVVFLAQLGMSRHPAIPNVPLVTEFAQTEDQRKVLELMARSTTLTRAWAMPPGVPMAYATALRTAFDNLMKDPAYIAEMKQRGMDMIDPMNWRQIDAFLADTAATPPAVVKKFQEIIGIKG